MSVLVGILAVAAFAAWLSAFAHGVWSLAHLSGKNSLPQMLLHGIRWFDAENFTPRGQQLQRRFVRSGVFFFGCVLVTIMAAALTAGSRPTPARAPLRGSPTERTP